MIMRPSIELMNMARFKYNKPASQILNDLIFAANGFMLPPTGVTYGTPVAIPSPVGHYSYLNTAVSVSIPYVPGVQNWGEKTFFYSRLNLANMVAVPNAVPITVASYPTDTYTLLPQINAYYGLQLTAADVADVVYEDAAQSFILTALPGSLIVIDALNFTGSVTGAVGITSDGTGTDSGWWGGAGVLVAASIGQALAQFTNANGGWVATGPSSGGSSGGAGSGSAQSDGTWPDVGPDWEPDGESGAEEGP